MAELVTFFGQEGGLWAALCLFLLWVAWQERRAAQVTVNETLRVQAETLRAIKDLLHAHDAQGRAVAGHVAEICAALRRERRQRGDDGDGMG